MPKKIWVCLMSFVFATACATGSGLTRKDILEQYKKIGDLDKEVENAEQEDADILASKGIVKAKENLEEAIAYASDGKKEKANLAASEGLAAVAEAKNNMNKGREIMKEVLATRDRALGEGASEMFPEELKSMEEQLREATVLIEKGEIDRAMEMRPALVSGYSELELRALKKGTVEAAKAAIGQAEKEGAGEYAPRTLKQAQEEIKLVPVVLEADRTQKEKANAHAQQTIWLARRASAITKIAKAFESKNYSWEDMILWYQQQLTSVNEPFGGNLPFDKENGEVVQSLREAASGVLKSVADEDNAIKGYRAQLEEQKASSKKQIDEQEAIIGELLTASRKDLVALRIKYESRMSSKAKDAAEAEQWEVEIQQKFEKIAESFKDEKASVTLQGRNVLITAIGFEFPSRGASIEANNFALLNKVVASLEKFPESKIVVSVHTDSLGGNRQNQKLSKKRAQSIAKFMVDAARISKDRIETKGLGESKPVASNDTKEGRTLNRRIEFLIVNE